MPKYFFKIDRPAGLGALAITVKPPPATAPATTAYLSASVKFGTKVLRNVMAALSLINFLLLAGRDLIFEKLKFLFKCNR